MNSSHQHEESVALGSHVYAESTIGFRFHCYLKLLHHNAIEIFNIVKTQLKSSISSIRSAAPQGPKAQTWIGYTAIETVLNKVSGEGGVVCAACVR